MTDWACPDKTDQHGVGNDPAEEVSRPTFGDPLVVTRERMQMRLASVPMTRMRPQPRRAVLNLEERQFDSPHPPGWPCHQRRHRRNGRPTLQRTAASLRRRSAPRDNAPRAVRACLPTTSRAPGLRAKEVRVVALDDQHHYVVLAARWVTGTLREAATCFTGGGLPRRPRGIRAFGGGGPPWLRASVGLGGGRLRRP